MKRILLGLHGWRDSVIGLQDIFQKNGYAVDIATTHEEMISYVKEKSYNRYLMDLNLGESNSPNITPAIDIYARVKERVESSEAKFLGISGNSDAVEAAREKGISASSKHNFFKVLDDFLE